jgi:ethanolamine ammonia-lyase small subunit
VMLNPDDSLLSGDMADLARKIKARTPARLLVGRAGAAYRTGTQMQLRQAHAMARDAVRVELDFERDLGAGMVKQWGLFEVCTAAKSKQEYLLSPHQGRVFDERSRSELSERCPVNMDLQIAIGDGLSVAAVSAQLPLLLPALFNETKSRGWTVGQAFVVRHCRVGILNQIGELLAPAVAVLLIGERPGLATAESLSAYMAYRPQGQHTDADRNLISNIHARGVHPAIAAVRIADMAAQMMKSKYSGTQLREESPPAGSTKFPTS